MDNHTVHLAVKFNGLEMPVCKTSNSDNASHDLDMTFLPNHVTCKICANILRQKTRNNIFAKQRIG